MEKQKILIVDDSEMNRILLTDILEGAVCCSHLSPCFHR